VLELKLRDYVGQKVRIGSAAVASSSNVKSSNVSKNDENTPPESLTLRLKKAETAVEVATGSLKRSGC
jgi:hypothetical protein